MERGWGRVGVGVGEGVGEGSGKAWGRVGEGWLFILQSPF